MKQNDFLGTTVKKCGENSSYEPVLKTVPGTIADNFWQKKKRDEKNIRRFPQLPDAKLNIMLADPKVN